MKIPAGPMFASFMHNIYQNHKLFVFNFWFTLSFLVYLGYFYGKLFKIGNENIDKTNNNTDEKISYICNRCESELDLNYCNNCCNSDFVEVIDKVKFEPGKKIIVIFL